MNQSKASQEATDPLTQVSKILNSHMDVLQWIENELMPTLQSFENEDDVIEFVKCKVESLIAQKVYDMSAGDVENTYDSKNFKATTHKFLKLFNMPEAEKLVNCEFVFKYIVSFL